MGDLIFDPVKLNNKNVQIDGNNSRDFYNQVSVKNHDWNDNLSA